MRIVLIVIAVLLVLTGLLWVGQGTGFIAWPPQNFMINEHLWAIRGAGLVLLGGALFWFARRP